MPSYCISTSTPGTPLYINGSTTQALTDDVGNSFFATSTCPNSTTTIQSFTTVDNPAQNMYNGLILFFVVMFFVVWYFLARFKLS